MNIEVIEFFGISRDEDRGILTGTLRIRLPDIGIHILGVYVSRRKDSWFFSLPGRNENHHETGDPIRYPFVVFEDRERQRELIKAIKEKGRAFIERKLADQENSISSPKTKLNEPEQDRQPKTVENSTDAKQNTSIAKSKSATIKDWQDPPKRKPVSQKPFVNR
jgi:hypothetical protein